MRNFAFCICWSPFIDCHVSTFKKMNLLKTCTLMQVQLGRHNLFESSYFSILVDLSQVRADLLMMSTIAKATEAFPDNTPHFTGYQMTVRALSGVLSEFIPINGNGCHINKVRESTLT